MHLRDGHKPCGQKARCLAIEVPAQTVGSKDRQGAQKHRARASNEIVQQTPLFFWHVKHQLADAKPNR
jgi:hypothetical protein